MRPKSAPAPARRGRATGLEPNAKGPDRRNPDRRGHLTKTPTQRPQRPACLPRTPEKPSKASFPPPWPSALAPGTTTGLRCHVPLKTPASTLADRGPHLGAALSPSQLLPQRVK